MPSQKAKARRIERFGLAIASLVSGICALDHSLPPTVTPFLLVCGVLAMALGFVALYLAGKKPERFGGTGIAIAGILLGISALGLMTSGPPRGTVRKIRCKHNLQTLATMLKIYSEEHSGMLPARLQVLTNLYYNPAALHCPMRFSPRQRDDTDFPAPDLETSYAYLVSGWQLSQLERYPQQLMLFCPLHNHGLLADGSVQKIDTAKSHRGRR